MYPTIVILLVNTQRSFVDTYGFTTVFKDQKSYAHDIEFCPATAGHLSFAMAHTKSDTSSDLIHGEMEGLSEKPLSIVTHLGNVERHHGMMAPF